MRRAWVAIALGVIAVYGGCVFAGMHARNLGGPAEIGWWTGGAAVRRMDWVAPRPETIPLNAKGESIRRGRMIFNETPLYASENVRARVSCQNCHAAGGIQPYASPMVGVPGTFPQFNARAARVITLQDRVQECFVRSENGRPLDPSGATMRAVVDYIEWLSTPQPGRKAYVGRGLVKIAEMQPDPARGKGIYLTQCQGCHGVNGEGRAPMFPPLWGADAFNDGAGMHGVAKMAAFVKHNMPQNRMGMLSAQEAWDVAAYVHGQARPAFNQAYRNF